jgi:hypothetical protein
MFRLNGGFSVRIKVGRVARGHTDSRQASQQSRWPQQSSSRVVQWSEAALRQTERQAYETGDDPGDDDDSLLPGGGDHLRV